MIARRVSLPRLRTPAAAAALAAALYVQWSFSAALFPGHSGRPAMFFWLVQRDFDGALSIKLPSIAAVTPREQTAATLRLSLRREGMWAPTRRMWRARFELGNDESLTESERRQVLTLVARDYARRRPEPAEYVAAPASPALKVSEPYWPGISFNSLAIAIGGALLYSLSSVPSWFAPARQRRRLRRGLCPGCGYDLGGLSEPKCPECGQSRGEPETKA